MECDLFVPVLAIVRAGAFFWYTIPIGDSSYIMYKTKTKLWIWSGEKGSWHFLTINKTLSAKIKKGYKQKRRGFGSIRVMVTIGETTWPTSIFPTKEGEFVLPVKASVRKKEKLKDGKIVNLRFEPVLH